MGPQKLELTQQAVETYILQVRELQNLAPFHSPNNPSREALFPFHRMENSLERLSYVMINLANK